MALIATLLFGSISFRHSWGRWHRYEGQPFHRAEFEVQQVYFEARRVKVRGGVSYAFGLVEGSRERMNVADYLRYSPGSQAELERQCPPGTRIPVYVFPELNGPERVQVYDELPPAEAGRRTAMEVLKYGLLILAGTGIWVFVLFRLLRLCVAGNG